MDFIEDCGGETKGDRCMDFTEGQLIDAKDSQGRWCEAEITAVEEGRIHIH
jgi:hypothetical protein